MNRDTRMQEVLDCWGPALERLSWGYERQPARREELLQEILLQLWRALAGFRGDASLKTFVFRVAHNVAATHVGRATRRQDEPLASEPAVEPDPDGALDRHQERERLRAAIRALPLPDRQLVLLHLEGLPHAEVAEVLGWTATNVSTRLSRVRADLATTLRSGDDR